MFCRFSFPFILLLLVACSFALGTKYSQAQLVRIIESYDASIGELPEGVAVKPNGPNKGDIYVTLAPTGELRRIDRKTYEGETFATFDVGSGFLLGMAFDRTELHVALASFDPATSGIWHVDDAGNTERIVDLQGFPNDLTFDQDGNMFITESISGSIFRVAAGTNDPVLWSQDPLLFGDPAGMPFPIGANGLTYDDQRHCLIVSTFQSARVVEIEDNDGVAGVVSVQAEGPQNAGADGIALGTSGDVYKISNFNSTLSRNDRKTAELTHISDADDGQLAPATLAFGQTGKDKRAVFVTNFGFGAGPTAPVSVLRIQLPEKSDRVPAGN